MEGFGVNTFIFVNEEGKARFVKFHWKPILGVHSLVWDEAQKLAGKDPDYHRRDIWDAINMSEFPEYELGVQMIDESEEFDFDYLKHAYYTEISVRLFKNPMQMHRVL